MNTYYKVVATLEGEREVLFGSFDRSDCEYEIEAERSSWKGEGYKGITIIMEKTTETPDPKVYG